MAKTNKLNVIFKVRVGFRLRVRVSN